MSIRYSLYFLFTISGFAGLIYESIWTHYLKLMLGHAAYAQTLVLSLFMGGMALGAWLCSRVSERIRRPLLCYALVEVALGAFALIFDSLFRAVFALLLDHLAPALGTPFLVDVAKWTIAGLLILPPCILLGATFPLISAAVFRLDPKLAGRTLGWLYFTNSIGAVLGVLTSGLLLVRTVGLPGTLMTAGLLNFLLAAGVWIITKRQEEKPPLPPSPAASSIATPTLLLAITFASSAASFCYEIGWIRMLSLVLGSATHSFELMLAAFILGLALGALLIRNRIDQLQRPMLVLAAVQIAMGVFALATLALYEQSFGWMLDVMRALAPTDEGYSWYLMSSAFICIAIMLPATVCAGMTLPLITSVLLRGGHGESSIGRVYAANTLGAIVGVLIAVHLLMPLLGVRQVIVIGGMVDLGLGLWLWRRSGPFGLPGRAAIGGAVACAAVFVLWPAFDQALLSSGVFREGAEPVSRNIFFHRDGKTATVHVYANGIQGAAISTNGKVDAALAIPAPTSDDYTMILTAALPLSIKPDAEDIAVIGFGSGRSTHTFLQSSNVKKVETIEIESAMVEGARFFGPLVEAAYKDPRSTIHIDDAKTYFARSNQRYDIIASEPSNPWVSGVASLFTREFYSQIKRYMKPGGLFVQWMQTYESDISLVSSVVGALQSEFKDYAIYSSNGLDLIIIASADSAIPPPGPAVFAMPKLASLLNFLGETSVDGLRLRYVGGPHTIGRWLQTQAAPANSDYFPYVDQHAATARFKRQTVTEMQKVLPYTFRLANVTPSSGAPLPMNSGMPALEHIENGRRLAQATGWLAGTSPHPGRNGPSRDALESLILLLSIRQTCRGPEVEQVWLPELQDVIQKYIAYLTAEDASQLFNPLRENQCPQRLAAYVSRWLDFAGAVSRKDYLQTREIGSALIAEELADGHELKGGLVYEVLLADLLDSGPEAMLARANALEGKLPQGPELDFLLAMGSQAP
ncbi:MAG: fused MFS/spermidine synthase [Pseudomonadota bacterium]|nr:fused MFS/spermidine synthase [Pseudomonadota bacterium]